MTLGYILYLFVTTSAIIFFGILLFMNYTSLSSLKEITPDNIYDKTTMNFVSCCLVAILIHTNLIILVLKGIYWLTHVKRK